MTYVWAAYSITFIVIFIYTLILGKRQKALVEEVEILRQVLSRD